MSVTRLFYFVDGHDFVFGMVDAVEKFVEDGADEHGNLRGLGGSVGIERMARENGSVDDGRPDERVGHSADVGEAGAGVLALDGAAGFDEFLIGQILELSDLRAAQV
jgi:hypothetical protein